MSALAACTIVSKNYLPFARVLARSFRRHCPEGRFFVLLVDRNEEHIDPGDEPFELVEVEELRNVRNLPSFLFKYTLLEVNTAIKPFFLEHLFERHGLEKLVYLDPDILITGSLDELSALLDRHAIVLTPHLTAPIDDDASPSELGILQAGSYNLGFLALRLGPEVGKLLAWWQERLYEHCVVRFDRGLFVDQKWMDLALGLFEGVYVLTHPGYNVAYWNLHGRRVTAVEDGGEDDYRVNGEPLVFFHFSGIEPESLEQVSKHQDRFTLRDLGDAAALYRRYARLLIEAGFHDCRGWPYAFGRFDDGTPISDLVRSLYYALEPAERRRFGDPFATGEGSFFEWLNQPAVGRPRRPPYLSRLVAHLVSTRPDVAASFPDVEGQDLGAFSDWMLEYGRHDLRLDDAFLGALDRGPRAAPWSPEGLRQRARRRLLRLGRSDAATRAKAAARRLLGPRGTERLRGWLRRPRPPEPEPDAAAAPPRRRPLPERIERLGVNLIGYLDAETGMGEAARALARAFEASSVPVSLHALDLNVLARRGEESFAGARSSFPYDVNLLVANADQVPQIVEHLGPEVFGGRTNVGFWLWELSRFPAAFRRSFDPLHEIWTPSTFCADAISAVSPLPVRRVPLPVAAVEARHDRAHFGLPEDAFIFYFMFNFLSYAERKNPLGLARAFRRAFGDRADDSALLVLKSAQSDFAPAARAEIERELEGLEVRWIDEYLARDEIASLTALADAYVSLHRSEGFGLTLAEAMRAGKPVVATPYSGNADFFNLNNGFPVRYRLVELERAEGPYPAGAQWAEPDLDHAAELLRRVRDDPEAARRVGERARRDVERQLGPETIARLLEERFAAVLRRVRESRPRRPSPT